MPEGKVPLVWERPRGGRRTSLCVAVWETASPTSTTIRRLQRGSNFYGITTGDYQSAIQDKAGKWRVFPNRTSRGCPGAYVTVYVDETRIQTNLFMPRP